MKRRKMEVMVRGREGKGREFVIKRVNHCLSIL